MAHNSLRRTSTAFASLRTETRSLRPIPRSRRPHTRAIAAATCLPALMLTMASAPTLVEPQYSSSLARITVQTPRSGSTARPSSAKYTASLTEAHFECGAVAGYIAGYGTTNVPAANIAVSGAFYIGDHGYALGGSGFGGSGVPPYSSDRSGGFSFVLGSASGLGGTALGQLKPDEGVFDWQIALEGPTGIATTDVIATGQLGVPAPRCSKHNNPITGACLPDCSHIAAMADMPNGKGYWLLDSNGSVYSYGDARLYGSLRNKHLPKPVIGIPAAQIGPAVGMAATPDGKGYWLVSVAGDVYSFGDARNYGSLSSRLIHSPIIAMGDLPDGKGYWLLSTNGSVYPFGGARTHGSAEPRHLRLPLIAMAATSDGRGYWLLDIDGKIYSFGDAHNYGSADLYWGRARPICVGAIPTNWQGYADGCADATGIAPTQDGHGYLVSANGALKQLYRFGDAAIEGQALLGSSGILAGPDSGGYWEWDSEGSVYNLGDTSFHGSITRCCEILREPGQ